MPSVPVGPLPSVRLSLPRQAIVVNAALKNGQFGVLCTSRKLPARRGSCVQAEKTLLPNFSRAATRHLQGLVTKHPRRVPRRMVMTDMG
jgi:hypothetical protein